MAKRVSLSLEDFRPLRVGEGGYSKTARNYVSPSTGEIISVRQFQKRATRTEIVTQSTKKSSKKQISQKSTKPASTKTRKSRVDKGMTRKDYRELIKPEIEARKKAEREERKRKSTGAPQWSKRLAQARYESAQKQWQKRHGIDANKDPNFYTTYDKIKHPDLYDRQDAIDAYSDLWGDDIYDHAYDYPFGETP